MASVCLHTTVNDVLVLPSFAASLPVVRSHLLLRLQRQQERRRPRRLRRQDRQGVRRLLQTTERVIRTNELLSETEK